MTLIRKANPKMIVKIWQNKIASKYYEEIKNGNLTFFLEKDYATDIKDAENSNQIVGCINRLKTPIKQMTKENQDKSMKYIQNLTELSLLIL
jgi:predicted transcriptional regulator